MPSGEPLPFSGPRGVRGLTSTIQRYAALGATAAETLAQIEGIYTELGGRFTSQSAAAALRIYATAKEQQIRATSLTRVRSDIHLTSRHIAYSTLQRSLDSFNDSPTYNVRYHVVGDLDGAPIDLWRTGTYQGQGAMDRTIGNLRDDLEATARNKYKDILSMADFNITDIQISAV